MREHDRVRRHTSTQVNRALDEQRQADVAALVGGTRRQVAERLEQLDAEWDVGRVLEANAAALTLTGVLLGAVGSRRWLLLAAVVPAVLLQHAVQGWCPPIEALRRMGVRTRGEIDAERTALKALRGDFDGVSDASPDHREAARRALAAAGRRD